MWSGFLHLPGKDQLLGYSSQAGNVTENIPVTLKIKAGKETESVSRCFVSPRVEGKVSCCFLRVLHCYIMHIPAAHKAPSKRGDQKRYISNDVKVQRCGQAVALCGCSAARGTGVPPFYIHLCYKYNDAQHGKTGPIFMRVLPSTANVSSCCSPGN